ncbi:hypothetical protein ACFOLL_08440 [Falsochrobactrum ovis]|uniref:Uncharacterized protein n=1 Tax=Falsochrobactrum ovis TaxID=1293442 RepID=A0A364JYZ5_9HYPH|nr:hypothetical protein [Falsochrobactrum ovis]RAK33779.1 hypothetical protein C7374_101102 [Falsochrobactrum ovis]
MSALSQFKKLHQAAVVTLSLIVVPISGPIAMAEDFFEIATPPATPPEINNIKLSEDLLSRMEKIHAALEELELAPTSEEGLDARPSMDSMIASLESRPQVVEIINAQNLTPREFLLTHFALMSSLAAADAAEETQIFDEAKIVNPEHLAFGQKYSERIRELMGE